MPDTIRPSAPAFVEPQPGRQPSSAWASRSHPAAGWAPPAGRRNRLYAEHRRPPQSRQSFSATAATGTVSASVRAEVPGAGHGPALEQNSLRRQQIARERFQHMLPGTDGRGRCTTGTSPASNPRIRSDDQPIAAQSPPPMTLPARRVASGRPAGAENAGAIGGGRKFRAALACAVGVVAAHRVAFPIGVAALLLVHLSLVTISVAPTSPASRTASSRIDRAHHIALRTSRPAPRKTARTRGWAAR